MLGDANELIKNIKSNSVDLILTDPPYELDTHGGTKNMKRKLHDNHIGFISNGFDISILDEMLRVCKIPNILMFCSNKQISKLMGYFESKGLSTTLLVWQKTNPIPFANGKYQEECEFIIYVRGKGVTFNNEVGISGKKKILTFPTIKGKDRNHPTEKPIDLLLRLLELHSSEGQTVLDPFMGSGSTGVAARRIYREFIGFEIDENYHSIATRRIEDEF